MLLAAIVVVQTPRGPVFLHVAQKLGHPIVFGLCALLILDLLPRPTRPGRAMHALFVRYGWTLGISIACGIATEIVQSWVHRDPSVFDVLRDALGASTALAARIVFLDYRIAGASRFVRPVAVSLSILGIGIAGAPMAWCLAAYANRDLHPAQLWQLRSSLDLYFVDAARCAPAVMPREMDARRSLCVALPPSDGPVGYKLLEPYPNWTGHTTLSIELSNPTNRDLRLTIRIDDSVHNQQDSDRFNRQVTLRALERTTVIVPLSELAAAPRGRTMLLRHIALLVIFRDADSEAGVFLLHRIWLQ
jgi:VanZ family protein